MSTDDGRGVLGSRLPANFCVENPRTLANVPVNYIQMYVPFHCYLGRDRSACGSAGFGRRKLKFCAADTGTCGVLSASDSSCGSGLSLGFISDKQWCCGRGGAPHPRGPLHGAASSTAVAASEPRARPDLGSGAPSPHKGALFMRGDPPGPVSAREGMSQGVDTGRQVWKLPPCHL